ncbi:hypothetical protein [Rhodococcus sp. PBTS 1]|uniref:Uncharacterized protein n=1 Tax=Rhodococcoides kroppenstedtii TaxID=293050 RepID=A0ABS7NV23_9NOCA|nr:hypothetical protein [Rhodococcus sp. PBTS 1]MBY6321265.1 hypothetical protein [Rhodococcus kroppenstedtii]
MTDHDTSTDGGRPVRNRHTGPGRCDTVSVAAATAALLSVPCVDDLTPADVQTVALDKARNQTCRAAESCHVALGRDADTASREARAAFDALCDVLRLADCSCDDSPAGYRVLAAAVADTVESVARCLRAWSGPAVPWEVGPDKTTVLHLRRAAAETTTVTGALATR